MFEAAYILAIIGAFLFFITVPYFLFVCIMYVVYKATNGKMGFWEYTKYW